MKPITAILLGGVTLAACAGGGGESADTGEAAEPVEVAEAAAAPLQVGDPAPVFRLPGSDGKTHDLADLSGRAVVVAWFPKAFTGG